MPRRVAVIGPIVDPHGMLLRDTNTCQGAPATSQARWNCAAVKEATEQLSVELQRLFDAARDCAG